MDTPRPIITLTSDFGHVDPYVGIMKGVMLARLPNAQLVDLTHDLPAQDVTGAALALHAAWRYFPPGTVHLAVVDPGVGTDRRVLAVQAEDQTFVAPDNGLLSLIIAEAAGPAVYDIQADDIYLKPISRTFHGRDVFAPVAAALAMGIAITDLGHAIDDPVMLDFAPPTPDASGVLRGRVLHVDRFGNLITNVLGRQMPLRPRITAGAVTIDRLSATYADVEPGQPLALIGSSGRLEISVRNGRADRLIEAAGEAAVVVEPTVSRDLP